MADGLIAVRVRDCPNGQHPEGDSVFILPKLSLEGGIAARQDVDEAIAAAKEPDGTLGAAFERVIIRLWMVTFCRYGAVGWNLHDEDGEIPFSTEALIADHTLAYPVADEADNQYREGVMRPLLQGSSDRSPNGPTSNSTSPGPTPIRSSRSSRSRSRSGGGRSGVQTG